MIRRCRAGCGSLRPLNAGVRTRMRCALCLKDAELCRSHVIPEFLYESLYDEKHRLHVLSVLPDQPNWREQKGLRERLLCEACEQLLSPWERYASLVLKGGVPLAYRREGNVVFISGLDYRQFKLFQLSVLWRAGISSLPFFSKVKLGKHAETLRKCLLTGNPGSLNDTVVSCSASSLPDARSLASSCNQVKSVWLATSLIASYSAGLCGPCSCRVTTWARR